MDRTLFLLLCSLVIVFGCKLPSTSDETPPVIEGVTLIKVLQDSINFEIEAVDETGITEWLVLEGMNAFSATSKYWSYKEPNSYCFDNDLPSQIYIWVKDSQGNVSERYCLDIPKDGSFTGVLGVASSVDRNRIPFEFGSDRKIISYAYRCYVDHQSALDQQFPDYDSVWFGVESKELLLPGAGTWFVVLWAKDEHNVLSNPSLAEITLVSDDVQPPDPNRISVILRNLMDGRIEDSFIEFVIEDSSGSDLLFCVTENKTEPAVYDSGWFEDSCTKFDISSLPEGEHDIYVWAKDLSGNSVLAKKLSFIKIDKNSFPVIEEFELESSHVISTSVSYRVRSNVNYDVSWLFTVEEESSLSRISTGWVSELPEYLVVSKNNGVYSVSVQCKDRYGRVSDPVEAQIEKIPRKWTFIYYADADNDLEQSLYNDLNEMESVNFSSLGIEVIVLLDRARSYYTGDGDWSDTRAFKIGYDRDGYDSDLCWATRRLVVPDLNLTKRQDGEFYYQELNMADPDTLAKFIRHCVTYFPAENFILDISNHGQGWKSSAVMESGFSYKSICSDDSAPGESISIKELKEAIESGFRGEELDVIAFDACLMSTIEVAYELKDCSRFMVGSETLIPGYGYPYRAFFNSLTVGNLSAEALCETLVDQYHRIYTNGLLQEYPNNCFEEINLAFIDLSTIAALAASIDELGTQLLDKDVSRSFITNTRTFPVVQNRDIYDLFSNLVEQENDEDVLTALNDVLFTLSKSVMLNKYGSKLDNAHGLSIYAPSNSETYDASYDYELLGFVSQVPNWRRYLSGNI